MSVLVPGAVAAAMAVAPGAAAAPAPAPPVVWVQAGHQPPGEPGYRAQTGAAVGPFDGEADLTARVAAVVERRLRAAGVDARHTPARVTPLGAPGATFVSLHHDVPRGGAVVGHAVAGAGENWYRGEGTGQPRPRPYPDSAPHRRATVVTPAVERRSRALAVRLARRYRTVFTPANGARSGPVRLESRDGNPRVMRFYGHYRTGARARALIELGAGGTDDRVLRRTGLIGAAVARGIIDDLRARGLLRRR